MQCKHTLSLSQLPQISTLSTPVVDRDLPETLEVSCMSARQVTFKTVDGLVYIYDGIVIVIPL